MGKVIRERILAGATILTTIKINTLPGSGKRKPKSKPSPDAVRKNNDRIAERNLTALINANFFPGDLHIILTYARAISLEAAKKELNNFIKRMRREYKKAGKEFRYIHVTEYKNKRIHHHIVMSYIDVNTIQNQWHCGRIRSTPLDKSRNYQVLANYLIKETSKTFRLGENSTKQRYTPSRNLERPVVVRETMSSAALFDRPAAIKGYAIDPDSINYYKHPFTQMEHLDYIMISTDPVPRITKWRKGTVLKRGESFRRFESLRQVELDDMDEFEWFVL